MPAENILPVSDIPDPRQKALKWVQGACDLMDNRFRIPGTQIRFGLDAVVGLVPYAGDMAGFAISGVLVLIMIRYGASGMVALRMLGNVALDAIVGSVPLLGDIFDLKFKANRRNFQLLQAHYEQGKYQGSAWWFVFLVLGILILVAAVLVWMSARLASALGQWMWGLVG